MNFKYKNFAFKLFEKIPFGEKLYALFQRYITKSLQFNDEKMWTEYSRKVENHLQVFKKYKDSCLNGSSYYEFGAGWHLLSVLGFSLAGMKRCVCVDINELIDVESVQSSLIFYEKYAKELGLTLPKRLQSKKQSEVKEFLKEEFGIHYLAPYDARNIAILGNKTIDFIVSNVTLEHIPYKDICLIMQECYRVLKDDGIISFTIDYQDHWSYFDSSISVYNMLQYDEKEWQKYNPSMHYQNRLRHCDYIEIFKNNGFKILEVKINTIREQDKESLKQIDLATCFMDYTYDELVIRGASFVLKKDINSTDKTKNLIIS